MLEKYGEKPVARGLANNGVVIEVLVSDDGKTWTIFMTTPKGISCLLASGHEWEQDRVKVPGSDS